jgi:hypothetical protein
MKKILFVAFCTVALCFASCGQKQAVAENEVANDSVLVDTTASDTLVLDSAVAE